MMLLKPVCAAALCRHGNCRLSSAAIQWWHTRFGCDSACVSLRGGARICSGRIGPPWGRKVFSIAQNMVVVFDSNNACVYKYMHEKHP